MPKVFLFLVVCLLASCGNVVLQNKPDLSLTMERSQCLGNCPVYRLKVLQSGQVTFEKFGIAEDFSTTRSKGKIESNLSKEKINQLIAEIDKTDYFSMKDDYTDLGEAGNCATDNPTVTLSIKLRGQAKKTIHDLGCMETTDVEKLKSLEDKIDEIVGTKKWIGEKK